MSKLLNWYEQASVNDQSEPERQIQPKSNLEQFMIDGSLQNKAVLDSSMRIGKDYDHERQARIIKQQMRTGLAPGLIDRNLDEIEKASSQSNFNAEEFSKTSPIVANWLSDPENAKLAYDDVATLQGLEWLFKAPAKAFREGSKQTQLAELRFKQLRSGLSDEELKLADELSSMKTQDLGADSWIQEAVIEASRQLPNMLESIKGGLETAIPASLAAGGTALAAGQLGPQVALPEEFVTVPAATITGAALGFRTGTLKTSFELEAGFAYDEFIKFKDINGQPLDDDVARVSAVTAGAINAGIELLQLDVLMKSFPGVDKLLGKGGTSLVKEALKNPTIVENMKTFAKSYGSLVTIETVTEIGQELVTMIAGEAAKMYQGEFEDADLAQIGERIIDTADAALKASVILSAPGPSATFVRDYAQTKKANQNRAVMESLGEIATNSKVHQRVPEKLREVVSQIKENGPVQDVMIPVEQWNTLFQSQNLDPSQVASEILGDNGRHYAEANATGADMVIPLEVYTERLAGSQYHSMLLDDVRFNPEEMTPREARKWESENQEYLLESMRNVAGQIVDTDQSSFIFDDVVGQLIQTGMERGTAETNAVQMQAAFRTLSSRTGIDVKELWDRYGPSIKREIPEALKARDFDVSLDPFIERIRVGDIPTEAQAFGPSLIETLRERGVYDEGGELGARDIDVGRKPFQRKIIREEGLTIDDAAQLMAEAGYIDKPMSEVTQNDLFEAIDRELSGDPVYSIQNQNARLAEDRATLLELSDYLDTLQVDFEQLSNEQIRSVLLNQVRGMDGESQVLGQERKVESARELQQRLISENEGVKISLRGSGEIAVLDKIIVPEDKRGSGLGTNLLNQINQWADENNKTIALTPSSDFGGTVSRLKKLYKSLGFVENKGKNKDYEISESMYREPSKSYQQEQRGQISISPDKDFEITFFDKADLSTMLHESGHLYLEVLGDLEVRGELSESMTNDMQEIRNWVGAKEGEQLTVDQHEQFARGFEAYLREGKAPSNELQGAFARFRGWLISIYRQLANLRVPMNEEIKGVFDRLLATDEEIRAAEQRQEFSRLFESAEEAGMTEAEFAKYKESATQARDDAQAVVAKKQMDTISREKKKWWKDAWQSMREEVMEEIAMNPTYQALSFLQKGELVDRPLPDGIEQRKIDKQSLVEVYGKDFLKRLPRPYIYTVEGGIHQDDIAAMFGFSSGDQMIQEIMTAPKMSNFVKAETDRRMRDRYGDIQTDGTLPDEAMAAVHNDKRSEVLAMELRALARKSRSNAKPSPATMMKQAAEASISRKLVRNVNPNLYLRAERKAAKEAQDLILAGDFDAALAAKQRQMLNFYLGNAARKAKEQTEKARDYLNGFNRPKKRQSLGKAGQEYLDQIDALLEKAEFRRVSLTSLDRRASLSDWISKQEEQGFSVDVPQELINQSQLINWKDMTVESLIGMRDAVKNIDHIARFKNKLLAQAEKRQFDEVVNDITGSIYAENKITPVEPSFAPSFKDTLKDKLSGYAAWHTKMEFLFEQLDGYKVNGPVWNALFKPIADAEVAEQQLNEKFTKKLNEILSVYTSKERGQWRTKKVHLPGIGSINKEVALSVALNWGNSGNRQAILDSKAYKWSELQVQQILDLLDERDWQTVQNIWDMVNELWPDIASLQKDLTGVAPEKVESSPVQTKYGEFNGGYYPLVYDTKLSNRAFIRDEKNASADLFENNFAKPATRKGHTIERVGSAGQSVKLSLDVIGQHMQQAIHDVTHRRAIMDVDRLSNDSRVRKAIDGAAGQEMYRQIRPWLQSIANERQELFSNYEKVLAHARTGATVVNMGIKVTTALAQPLGFLQTVDVVGGKYAMRGLTDFFGKPSEMQAKLEFVMDRSTMMRNRQQSFDRDVRDSLNRMRSEGTLDKIGRSYFYFTGLLDMAVSVPTWLGAYRKAMDGNVDGVTKGNEQQAIDYADRSVRVSQSSGGTKDLARIQRGSQTFRLFTMFYSYFSVLYNLMQTRYGEFRSDRKSIPETAASFFFLIAGPAVLGELVASRGPEEDEDPVVWAGKQIAMYPFMTVVGLRDVVSAMGPFGYSASPAFDAMEHSVKALKIPYKLATDEDVTRSDVKSAVLATSYWGKLPGRQAWITGEYLYDVMSGEDSPEDAWEFTHNLMFARPASER